MGQQSYAEQQRQEQLHCAILCLRSEETDYDDSFQEGVLYSRSIIPMAALDLLCAAVVLNLPLSVSIIPRHAGWIYRHRGALLF